MVQVSNGQLQGESDGTVNKFLGNDRNNVGVVEITFQEFRSPNHQLEIFVSKNLKKRRIGTELEMLLNIHQVVHNFHGETTIGM